MIDSIDWFEGYYESVIYFGFHNVGILINFINGIHAIGTENIFFFHFIKHTIKPQTT